MSSKDDRDAPDDDDNWVTVGARPRQKTAPLSSAPAHSAAGGRKKRQDPPMSARRTEHRENDWQLVMRSRQALTKLRDEDFALTRLGQVHTVEPRKPNPRPAARSRLGARFPTEMASDRPNRPPAVLRRPVRLVMPKFDLPLRSEADFPSLRGVAESSAPAAAGTERRRSSVAHKLDESLRSMAGAAAQQGEPAASDTAAAAPPMPQTPPIRPVAYAEAVSWRARPAKKSERRDVVRGEIREDIAMLQTATAQKSAAEAPPAAAEPSPSSAATGETPQKKKEKEKRQMKKAKKKESQLILARLNASKDTHVQLVTADAFERLNSPHSNRWRRSQAEAVDLRAADHYPSLAETAVAQAAAPATAAASAAATAAAPEVAPETPTEDPPQRDSVWRTSGSHEPRPPDRKDGGAKTYSRMLRELPKSLPPPVNVKELVEAKETKKKAPKKRMPIEASIMDLAFMPASRSRRSGQQDDGATSAQRSTTRRLVKPVRAIGNRLDSSVLVHKRGKERTKKKKPSLLKRVILRERAERRRRAGLEAAATALFAGLSVREVGEGGVEGKTEPGGAAEGASVTVGQADSAQPQAEETDKTGVASASVVGQDITSQNQDSEAARRREQSASSAVEQQTTMETPFVILKRESVSTSPQKPTPEVKQAFASLPESVQKVIIKIKQEPLTPTAVENVPQETDQAQKVNSLPNKSATSVCSVLSSTSPVKEAQDAAVKQEVKTEPKQENNQKPDEAASPAPVADSKDSGPAGDDNDDEPPSRGPDYNPCITVDPKVLIHSSKFREYCQQALSPEIDESARLLLQDLTRFQDRLYNRDPIKARARRRLVFGLREVSKHLAVKKLACVILAPNIEKIETAGGLDQAVERLLTLASEREVPLVFALKRRALGHACKKPVPVSCVGIFNYQGSEDNYKRLMQLTEAAQERYRAMVADVERALRPPPPQEELSPSEKLLGVIDDISRQKQPPLLSEPRGDDPTHSLLAKLRSVTIGGPVSG
ncbi:selenocysteine insertion sequence-binding protein 2-like isoform X2 [Amphibalanus amphitrite]|nr:selenocysteine insertion sequence-binding protein 2-like isoform X2 [Amphibalanus amphitrite]XP_043247057.1 selenocysteine insertion sequence-binding protein 2-like isoform X2 [Amphibalanus amphitrite]XP_043247142.1 selenocysteine insertion sequence-binding protein 2-like isoform X2 [Amphibalanus amphitrite]XP_043247219.1 selenocysteine insertion sequence-binding protein 2-like isoform X2 [Amphibalanus amphitrite]XP_043247291.1 selenocysteine insertion sequence-binding protein 2-like isoform